MGKIIEFYKTLNGKCPVEKFLDSLDGKTAQKVVWVLKLIEELDIVPKTYFKKLSGTEAIWECRIQSGSNIYRIFCFFAEQNKIVLTHGIVKKTQKTPKNEIKKAEKYRKKYLKL